MSSLKSVRTSLIKISQSFSAPDLRNWSRFVEVDTHLRQEWQEQVPFQENIVQVFR